MAAGKRFSVGRILVWTLLALLVVGLAGFGIGDIIRGGFSNTVAEVGGEKIGARDYARALVREINATSQREGRQISIAEARAMQLDQLVLGRMTRTAALRAEARRLGLSVSDATVQADIAAIPAFRGPDGSFSPEAARLALESARVTEAELRDDIREEATRGILIGALVGDARLPPGLLQTVLAWRGEQRRFAWLRLDPDRFGGAPEAPGDDVLAAHLAAHADLFTRPETRRIVYAILDVAHLAETIEIPEAEVEAAYQARIDSFRTPERRAVERLTFPDRASAEAALARIRSGEATLAQIAAERGFAEANIALGEVTAEALDPAARDAVFGLSEPGVVGPIDTALGPALFAVNAILAAQETPREEAMASIRKALQLERARERAQELAAEVEDMIAGGATVEEIAAATPFEAGRLDLPVTGPAEGLAADPRLREVALSTEVGRESDLAETADGRQFVLRVEEVVPAALPPLEEIRDAVLAHWIRQRQLEATRAVAEDLVARVAAGTGFARAAMALGLTPAEGGPVRRDSTPEGLPPALVAAVFATDPGSAAVVQDDTAVWVVQPTTVISFDVTDPANSMLAAIYQQSFDAAFRNDLFTYYVFALENRDGVRIYPDRIEAALATIR
ncbi:MAG: peptidyl-prolyl cis-trans isomerase [Paracoccaceae bacterium]|nr:MAG: peptidyl-prolyl cis-trans isomerase [Paracoccaceae bacterium]